MKRFILIFGIILFSNFGLYSQNTACQYKGIKLWGDVFIREYIADISVYVSEYGTRNSLDVYITQTPNRCGEWNIRDGIGDFSIRFVEYPGSADIVIVIKNMSKKDFIDLYQKK